MQFPQAMMHEEIWFDRPKYEEAEEHYQLYLTNNLSAHLAKTHSGDQQDGLFTKATNAVAQVAYGTGSALVNEIAKARDSIKQSLAGMSASVSVGGNEIADIRQENKRLSDLVIKLAEQVASLELRVTKLEGGDTAAVTTKKGSAAKDDDDDDFDLFDDDDEEEEEETEAEKKRKEELLRKYHEKKAGKKQVIAKSNVIFNVKPWDDETDMGELERLVRTIEMDGLLWGASKLVPLAYGIKLLQIVTVVEDDKVSTEELSEKICEFEDYIQSADIIAFNKI